MGILHRNLDVYQVALEFVGTAAEISKRVPRGQSYLVDQLKRSASSTVLNTGEGAGEFSKKEKIRFYRMALRSATESASTIDIINKFGYIDEQLYGKADRELIRVISMLTKLVLSHQCKGNGVREREPLR